MTHRSIALVSSAALLMLLATGAAAQEPGADTEAGIQRTDIPEAGISLAFPEDWSVVVQMIRDEAVLPPELGDDDSVDIWIVAEAAAPDGSGCALLEYDDHPLSLHEHAEWAERALSEEPEVTAVTATDVELGIGDAVRLDVSAEGTGVWAQYFFESDDARYQLYCFDTERHDDDWLPIVESVEFIPFAPMAAATTSDTARGEGVDYVLDFPSVVSVVPPDTPGYPLAALMNVDCAFAMWVPADDGSATEWIGCTLSDDPLQPPEQQGVPPTEVYTESGGECVWRSDYWYQTDQTQVVASAYSLVITPDGQVYGWSSYPAEPLDCDDV